jgi:hypothetical protein
MAVLPRSAYVLVVTDVFEPVDVAALDSSLNGDMFAGMAPEAPATSNTYDQHL